MFKHSSSSTKVTAIWSWNNNGHWQDFDTAASQQIDDELHRQFKNTNLQTIVFPITKGAWFSQAQNNGVYFCNIQLNASRTKIQQAVQQNIKTGFCRQMRRTPPFNAKSYSLSSQQQSIHKSSVNTNNSKKAVWLWHDDNGWKEYDEMTCAQIENAYSTNAQSVCLNVGPFFSATHRKNVYVIQLNLQQFVQINKLTNFQRSVQRICNDNDDSSKNNVNDDNKEKETKLDKNKKWKKYYRPMKKSYFEKLADDDKLCSICFCEFDESNLYKTQCEIIQQVDEFLNDSDGDSHMIGDDDDTKQKQEPQKNEQNDSKKEVKKLSEEVNVSEINDSDIVHLSQCVNFDHYFHAECIARWLDEKGKCSHCQKRYGIETGNQPMNGSLHWSYMNASCSGFENVGSIRITFSFQGGVQTKEHYRPGQYYDGDRREAYVPNNEIGREALELTKIAFERRLIFSIGQSLTTKRHNRIVWASIHFKTRLNGGQLQHGYPDETYFDRFKKELAVKGITTDDLDENALKNIKNGIFSN